MLYSTISRSLKMGQPLPTDSIESTMRDEPKQRRIGLFEEWVRRGMPSMREMNPGNISDTRTYHLIKSGAACVHRMPDHPMYQIALTCFSGLGAARAKHGPAPLHR